MELTYVAAATKQLLQQNLQDDELIRITLLGDRYYNAVTPTKARRLGHRHS